MVRLSIELSEQKKEHNSMHSDPPDKGFWIVAINEQQLEGMEHNQNELNLLTMNNVRKEIL